MSCSRPKVKPRRRVQILRPKIERLEVDQAWREVIHNVRDVRVRTNFQASSTAQNSRSPSSSAAPASVYSASPSSTP